MADDYMPILINGKTFALDLDCEVKNIEILNAITKGIPVRTEKMKQIENNFNNESDKIKRIWVDIT